MQPLVCLSKPVLLRGDVNFGPFERLRSSSDLLIIFWLLERGERNSSSFVYACTYRIVHLDDTTSRVKSHVRETLNVIGSISLCKLCSKPNAQQPGGFCTKISDNAPFEGSPLSPD